MYSLHSIKTLETRRIKRFPAKTFTNVGMVQRVIKNRVCAQTLHWQKGQIQGGVPCQSGTPQTLQVAIHCLQDTLHTFTQVNSFRHQDTLNPLSPFLHLATSFCTSNNSNDTIVTDIHRCDPHGHTVYCDVALVHIFNTLCFMINCFQGDIWCSTPSAPYISCASIHRPCLWNAFLARPRNQCVATSSQMLYQASAT